MKVLAVSRPVSRSIDELAPLLMQEAASCWHLYASDTLREIYLRDDGGVVMVMETRDVASARDLLARLPLAASGLLSFDVWALAPFTPWGRLQAAPVTTQPLNGRGPSADEQAMDRWAQPTGP